MFTNLRYFLSSLSSLHSLPAIYLLLLFANALFLMSYCSITLYHYYQCFFYFFLILLFSKPSYLPFLHPTNF